MAKISRAESKKRRGKEGRKEEDIRGFMVGRLRERTS
jgi:hypothetical protein